MTQWLILIIISKDSVKSNSRFIFKKKPYDNLLWQSEVQYPHFVMNLIFSWETYHKSFFHKCIFHFPFVYSLSEYCTKICYGKWVKGNLDLEALSPCMSNEQNNFNFLNDEVFLVSLPLHMILY